MNNKQIKQLLKQGESLREEAKFEDALHVLDQVIIQYQKIANYKGMIVALKDHSLTWLHLYNYSQDTSFAILSKKDAESMVDIANEKDLPDQLAISYFTLAKSNILLKEHDQAVTNYQLALDNYDGSLAEHGDYLYHLGEALCLSGDNDRGLKMLKEGLQEIRKGRGEVEEFLANVWESRCLMMLAKFTEVNDSAAARRYALDSQKIIESDDRLIILNKQLTELIKNLQPLLIISFSTTLTQNFFQLATLSN